MAEIADLSTTDASNIARFPEGQNPSTVNNGARALEGMIARALKDTVETDITSTGSANAYVVAANRTLTAYYAGLRIAFKTNFANTGAATVNVDALGAKNIFKRTSAGVAALASGDIQSGDIVDLIYDGTQFQLLSSLTNGEFSDATFTIQDNSDATKQVRFQASGLTTATIRTLTVPDASTTLVGTDATQTLTNKTIDGASNTVSNVAKSILSFESGGNLSAGTTRYMGTIVASATNDILTIPMPYAGTLEKMYARPDGSPGTGETFVYTVRKNDVDSALTCTVSGTNRQASDTSNTVSVAVGDTIEIKVVTSAASTQRNHRVSLGYRV